MSGEDWRDLLRDWWDEDETASVESCFPIVARLLIAAWDEGHRKRQRRGPDDCQCAAWSEGECACGRYGSGPLVSLADNPYRETT